MPHKFQAEVIGCGDAYDSRHTNASLLIQEKNYQLLIDCGPTVPAALLGRNTDPEALDAVYLTHAHPDHCLGLTTLINWMDARQRQRPLTIIVQQAQESLLQPLISFACWPQKKIGFAVHCQDTESVTTLGEWRVTTPKTRHAVANRSLHISNCDNHQLFYSGDGQLSAAGEQLAAQSDWVFLECETLCHHHSHGSWQDIARLPRKVGSEWRLYHIDPAIRSRLAGLLVTQENLSLAEEKETFYLSADGVSHVA